MLRLSAATLSGAALAAAMMLAVPAQAQETRSMAGVIPGYEPSPFEQNLADIETRMAEFGARMEALQGDRSLAVAERRDRQAALWREYGPDLIAFSTSAAEMGVTTAGTMMESMNVTGLVAAALSQADVAVALASVEIESALAEAFAEMQTAWTEAAADGGHDTH